MLEADQDALQRMIDHDLNVLVKPKGFSYRSILPRVMLAFFDFPRIISVNSPDSNLGYIQERDVSFWVPMVATRDDGKSLGAVEPFAWYTPFMFVDNAWACASGREIYGYDKEMATIESPRTSTDPANFTVNTLVIERFRPESLATNQVLIELEREDSSILGDLTALWGDMTESATEAWRLLSGMEGPTQFERLGLATEVFEKLASGQGSTVLLKQFLDSANPENTCFQELIQIQGSISNVRNAGPLPGHYQLKIHPCDSHPIAERLGLSSHQPRVLEAFHLEMDLLLGLGTVI